MHARLTCFLLALTLGCSQVDGYNAASPDRLGKAVIEALNTGDGEALHALRVSKDVYVEELYPSFPSSRNNFAANFAWGNLNKKCVVGVKKWISRFGQQDYQYAGIRFERPREFYGGFSLLRGTVLEVKKPDGTEQDLRILGSVVVRDGSHTLLSYDD